MWPLLHRSKIPLPLGLFVTSDWLMSFEASDSSGNTGGEGWKHVERFGLLDFPGKEMRNKHPIQSMVYLPTYITRSLYSFLGVNVVKIYQSHGACCSILGQTGDPWPLMFHCWRPSELHFRNQVGPFFRFFHTEEISVIWGLQAEIYRYFIWCILSAH